MMTLFCGMSMVNFNCPFTNNSRLAFIIPLFLSLSTDDSLFAEEDDDFIAFLNSNMVQSDGTHGHGQHGQHPHGSNGNNVNNPNMMMSPHMMPPGTLPPGTIYHNGIVYHPNQPIVYNGTTMMVPSAIIPGQTAIVTAPSNIPGGPIKRKMMVSKNDKRRHYAKMYAEAFNSGDNKLLLNFLETYCTADCIVIQRCVVKENPFIPKYVEIHGIQAIHEFWTQTFITIPDCLIVMLETKLRIRNNQRPPGVVVGQGQQQGQSIGMNASGLSTNAATAAGASNTEGSSNGSTATGAVTTSPGGTSTTTDGGAATNASTASSGASTSGNNPSSNAHLEGSSIVCSFSFTGTKIYTMTMEGAVLHPEGTVSEVGADGNPVNSGGASSSGMNASTGSAKTKSSGGGEGTVQALITKSQQRANKKRSHNADWPATGVPTGTDNTGSSSAGAIGTVATASHPEPSSDRYNIFLHPPRRFSTLAGTPYGGNASHYTHHSNKQKGNHHQHAMVVTTGNGSVARVSDFVSIDANTKFKTGQLTEKEGFINFLGTLTMYLDANNKISKFEFLYSNFD